MLLGGKVRYRVVVPGNNVCNYDDDLICFWGRGGLERVSVRTGEERKKGIEEDK